MNRSDLQQLAEMRLAEARILFEAKAFAGAYYLAGYAVECALKACIAKQVREFDFPDKRLAERSYTHDLNKLAEIAGLGDTLEKEIATSSRFALKWQIVENWSEARRYEVKTTEEEAQNMLGAVENPDGVVAWLKKFW